MLFQADHFYRTRGDHRAFVTQIIPSSPLPIAGYVVTHRAPSLIDGSILEHFSHVRWDASGRYCGENHPDYDLLEPPPQPTPAPTLYAIKRISDGKFLPAGRRRSGFTLDVPSDDPPRLFLRERDARMALDYWLRGELHVSYSDDRYTGYEGVTETIIPKPDRRSDEMTIVRISLTEISQ